MSDTAKSLADSDEDLDSFLGHLSGEYRGPKDPPYEPPALALEARLLRIETQGAESILACTLRLSGELDLDTVPQLLCPSADTVLASGRFGALVLDLEDVWFVDSAGLGVFVELARQGLSQGVGVGLSLPPAKQTGQPARVLNQTRLDTVMPIVGTPEQAAAEAWMRIRSYQR